MNRNTILIKSITAAEWTSLNTLLKEGEPGIESDTGKMKVGDGNTRWTSLAYQANMRGVAVFVSATEPAEKEINDLWIQI